MINRALIGIGLAGATAVGAAGFAFGYSGGDDDEGVAAPPDGVGYHACPDSGVVGELVSGDRVFLTGTDESGGWLQLRSPQSESGRVWIPGDAVDPDEVVDLPVAGCALEPFEMAMAETNPETNKDDGDDSEVLGDGDGSEDPATPTTVAVPGPTPTPTTTLPVPVPTPTTAPPTPTPTPTTSPPVTVPTPTTAPPPPPTVESASVAHSTMIRRYMPQPGACEAQATSVGAKEVSTLTASGVTNASSVTYEVRVGHAGGHLLAQGSMTSAGQGTWHTQLGPYPWTSNNDPHSDRAIWVRVFASSHGETSWATTTFFLRNCNVPD